MSAVTLHRVGNAYATEDLRYRVQRDASKTWYLFDSETRERVALSSMAYVAIAMAVRIIAKYDGDAS